MPTRLPFDPAACASVLALATEILDSEPDDAQDLLRPLMARDETVTAELAEHVDAEVHSSEIQAAFGLRVHHGGTRTTRHPEWGGRRPRFFHIPQVLPRAWCADGFAEAITMRAITSEKIRSAAAVRLVQVLHDVDAWEAASLLENRAGERDLSDVRRILPRPVWDAFCDTVDRIATDLSSTKPLRNYQRLRRRMATWRLSETLAAQLLEGIRGGMACRDNARCRGWLHHYLEARIWTAATDGAFDAAPTMTNIDTKMRYYIAGRFHQHMAMPPKWGFATLIARAEDHARILATELHSNPLSMVLRVEMVDSHQADS